MPFTCDLGIRFLIKEFEVTVKAIAVGMFQDVGNGKVL